MATRGSIAKGNVVKKIAEAFGNDYIGEYNKKFYVWANDGGERVQIALTLVCPNTFIEVEDNNAPVEEEKEPWDWSGEEITKAPEEKKKVEVSEEEQSNIQKLLKKFNLI